MSRAAVAPLSPGAVIGILGGGQLGRMLALAAARLGFRCHVFCSESNEPGAQVSNLSTVATFDDEDALTAFASAVDVVTYEFENIPSACVAFLQDRVLLRPAATVLHTCQDRLHEKEFLHRIGAPLTAYAAVGDAADLAGTVQRIGRPAVLKTSRLGYDGKGQTKIVAETDLGQAWAELMSAGSQEAGVIEAWVDFAMEISVIVARAADGTLASYVPVQNIHDRHILKRTIAPAPIPPDLAAAADSLARGIAEALGLVGVLCVEMFVANDGRLLVNELAPRPHNSGHWTIDACATSQFEQCVRAVAGLPLGSTERVGDAVMENLLGEEVDRWPTILAEPGARLHLYGKAMVVPGRKMGHVTRLLPR